MYLLFFLTNVLGVDPALEDMRFSQAWDVISTPLWVPFQTDALPLRGRRVTAIRARCPSDFVYLLFIAPGFQTEFANALQVSLGLHGFHGCGYAAVDEGQVIISAVRIRTHTQTAHIYDIYYIRNRLPVIIKIPSGVNGLP